MRTIILAALALAACSPPAPPPEPAAPPAVEAAAPPAPSIPDPNALSGNPAFTWDDVDQDPQLIGQWFYNEATGGAFITASFGGADSEPSFNWVCDRHRRMISLVRDIGLAPDQRTGLGIIIPGARHLFEAQSYNEGPEHIAAEIPAADTRLDAIAASAEGFAVQVAGDTTRIRHDPMLARVLASCRA